MLKSRLIETPLGEHDLDRADHRGDRIHNGSICPEISRLGNRDLVCPVSTGDSWKFMPVLSLRWCFQQRGTGAKRGVPAQHVGLDVTA